MQAKRSTPLPAAEAVPPSSVETGALSSLPVASCPEAGAKLLLVEFRSGEAVGLHPEVMPLLHQGWRVRSAVPRIVEGEGLKLLVSLTQPEQPSAGQVLKPTKPRTSSLTLSGKI